MPDSAEELVQDMYSTLRQGGPEELLARYEEFFSADFEWTPVLIGSIEGRRTYVGREEFSGYWEDFSAAFDEVDPGAAPAEALDDGWVMIDARLRVRGTGSGVPIDRNAAYLFKVRDGRIVAARSFWNRADALTFLADSKADSNA